jgi:hypothetical protein
MTFHDACIIKFCLTGCGTSTVCISLVEIEVLLQKHSFGSCCGAKDPNKPALMTLLQDNFI